MRVVLTEHAIDRFKERVRPALVNRDQAERELRHLIELAGEPISERPFPATREPEGEEAYLELAPGVWLGLVRHREGWAACTCLTNAVVSRETRKAINGHKALMREERRARSRKGHSYRDRPRNRELPEL